MGGDVSSLNSKSTGLRWQDISWAKQTHENAAVCWDKKVRRNGEGAPRGPDRSSSREGSSAGACGQPGQVPELAKYMNKMWVTRGETTVVTGAMDGGGESAGPGAELAQVLLGC